MIHIHPVLIDTAIHVPDWNSWLFIDKQESLEANGEELEEGDDVTSPRILPGWMDGGTHTHVNL